MLAEPDYRRVNAMAEGERWNADVTIRRTLSQEKLHGHLDLLHERAASAIRCITGSAGGCAIADIGQATHREWNRDGATE
jgi:hypothetical protein